MKQIPKADFIRILEMTDIKDVNDHTNNICEKILQKYGDDWFMVNGVWALTVENQSRKNLLQ